MRHDLPPFRLEAYLARREFTARHNLSASDVQSLTLAELLELASPEDRRAFERVSLGYTESRGDPWLRALIAGLYEDRAADDILCFSGAEEGIVCALTALLGPDDHAIVTTPCYQSLETVPARLCETTALPLDPAAGWALDLDRLAALIRPTTRAVVTNWPHNPTGALIDHATFEGLVALARRHGLWLFVDEVYRGLERDPARRLPQIAEVYERGVSLGVLSKSYGLPGLRVGWVVTRARDRLAAMEQVKYYLSICGAAPSEALARIALKARDRLLARNRALVEDNLKRLDAVMRAHPDLFEWQVPAAGCIAFPRYLGAEGVEAFANRLHEDAGVLVLPASAFQSELAPTPDDRVRLGFGRAGIDESLAAFRQALAGPASDDG